MGEGIDNQQAERNGRELEHVGDRTHLGTEKVVDEENIELEAADGQEIEHQPKDRTLQAMCAPFEIEHERAHDLKHEKDAAGEIFQPYPACCVHND